MRILLAALTGFEARTIHRLLGSRKAVTIAVRNVSGRRRWSKLRERFAALPAGAVAL